ncbi:MAG: hypothetical protein A2487_18330, partial [Candidatus Raymondbacteria bacterium RifOxyC12_full_50_8]
MAENVLANVDAHYLIFNIKELTGMKQAKLQTKKFKDALFIRYSGNDEEDLRTITSENIKKCIEENNTVLVLDLESVKHFFSVSISRLVEVLKTTERMNARLYLVNVPESVLKVLSMVNIISKFKIYRSDYEFISQYEQEIKSSGASVPEAGSMDDFSVSREKQGNREIVRITDSLVEEMRGYKLLDEIKTALAQGIKNIALDFANVDYVDSVGIGVLMAAYNAAIEKGVVIKVENANDIVRQILNE